MVTQLVLVTGLSASGKSALSKHLTERGERAISLDGHPGLCRWEDSAGQPIERPSSPDLPWLQSHSWNWCPAAFDDVVAAECNQEHRRVFLCGMAANQDQFRSRFDVIIMLDVSRQVMLARLGSTSRGNDFGRTNAAKQFLADRYDPDREGIHSIAHYVINAAAPLYVVANLIRGVAAIHQLRDLPV